MKNIKSRLPGLHMNLRKKDHLLAYLFIAPFLICFFVFIVLPCLMAALLAFTSYDAIQFPKFIGFDNFIYMLTRDQVLMKYVIPNTFIFAVIVGPGGYIAQFMLAWLINKIPKSMKIIYIMAIYTPSIAGGVLISVVWTVFFNPDKLGYLNNFLINIGFITNPIAWTQEKGYLLVIMIIVTLWGSMGVGFLSLFSGMQNVDQQLYEAGEIDGISHDLQKLFYITIPSMKPQMLFSAIMAITGALNAGDIGVQLSGSNPTPDYAGQLIQNHINDFGFARMQLGYATSLSLMVLIVIYVFSQVCWHYLGSREEN